MIRKLLDVLFWIAASLYFGGLLALGAIVAPAVFDTTRDAKIVFPGTPSSLDATRQAGGEIFGVILQRFWYLELGALSAILVVTVAWMLLARPVQKATWLIAGLWLLIAALTAYDAFSLTPRVWEVRKQVRTTAAAHVSDAKDAPWPEHTEFDALHKRSEFLSHIKAYALLAMIVAAAWRGEVRSSRRRLAR